MYDLQAAQKPRSGVRRAMVWRLGTAKERMTVEAFLELAMAFQAAALWLIQRSASELSSGAVEQLATQYGQGKRSLPPCSSPEDTTD